MQLTLGSAQGVHRPERRAELFNVCFRGVLYFCIYFWRTVLSTTVWYLRSAMQSLCEHEQCHIRTHRTMHAVQPDAHTYDTLMLAS